MHCKVSSLNFNKPQTHLPVAVQASGHRMIAPPKTTVSTHIFRQVFLGKRGRSAIGKTLVAVAVETCSPKDFGRCRLRIIPNAQASSLRSFLLDCVELGSVIVTDGLRSYPLPDRLHAPAISGGPLRHPDGCSELIRGRRGGSSLGVCEERFC